MAKPMPESPCEDSSREYRRKLDMLTEQTRERLAPLQRRTRQLKRDLDMTVTDDSGSHEAITVPNRTLTLVEPLDPFPSPGDLAGPSRSR